jgi:hypothetical protein
MYQLIFYSEEKVLGNQMSTTVPLPQSHLYFQLHEHESLVNKSWLVEGVAYLFAGKECNKNQIVYVRLSRAEESLPNVALQT